MGRCLLILLTLCLDRGAQGQTLPLLYFSTAANGAVPGVASPFDDADIYTYDGTAYGRSISAVTNLQLPASASLDALAVVAPNILYLSFSNASITLPGLGTVLDEDVVKYEAGVWSRVFTGATCGLGAADSGDIDAIAVVGDRLLFSTLGNLSVSGLLDADDADIYQWVQGGAACTRVFDASAAGLPGVANVDALDVAGGEYYLSFARDAGTSVPGLGTVQDEAVVAYDAAASSWSLYFQGVGLNQTASQDVDAISLGVTDVPAVPSLSIVSPANNATVSGPTLALTYATSGNLAEARLAHFQLDGGTSAVDTTLDGQFQLTGVATGAHSLTGYLARADGSKIEGSDAATVNFTVGGVAADDPSLIGQWSNQIVSLPTVAVNLALLHTGKLIFWAGHFNSPANYGELWDPQTNQITPVPNPYSNIFCSSNTALADGSLLVAGGHDKQNGILGLPDASRFDPATQAWSKLPALSYRRWYPTLTTLGDGRAIIVSGSEFSETEFVQIPEIYDPVANTWTQLGNAALSMPQYPMMYLLPDGRLLETGSTEYPTDTRILDVAAQRWSVVDPRVLEGGSGVMYAPGRIMKSGSASQDGLKPTAASANTTYVLDMDAQAPAWRQTASMAFPRTFHNLTSLADGSVLVTGGTRLKNDTSLTPAVLEAELWSPGSEAWTTMAPMQTPRIYHSTAVLLPDGRVAVSGSGNLAGATDMKSLEVYSPPYLFKGPRPTIGAAPAQLRYGASFTVQTPDAADIKAVHLLRPGAATHNFDMNQRFVPLAFTRVADGIEVQATANPNIAPPGYYMLFLINNAGVPSVASFVRFPAPYEDAQPPTAPGNLGVSTVAGGANLSWDAATDNLGVVRYEIHRAATPGFTPSAATRIGQTAALSYTDSGLASGTYYYVVVAVDAAGNSGPPSNQVGATITADATPPVVALTSPLAGATVSGAVTLAASASDNVAVAGVQFKLDGAALGGEDTAAPYAYAWNTQTTTNGTHRLTAVARDAANNAVESAPVTVTVANTQQVPAGVVAAYGFEEGGGTRANDASGNGNHGTLSGGASWAAGHSGGALAFDGLNGLMTVADAATLDLTTGMTLEAWVYPTALSGFRTVLMKEVSGDLAYALYAHDDAPRPAGYVRIGANSPAVEGNAALPLNAWTHLALSYDGANLRLYVNGAEVGSRALTGAIATSNLPLRIGGNSVWGEYFSGRVDEVRVYNRALSASEIQAAMSVPVQPPPVVQPTRSGPIQVDTARRRVWVVNPDNDSVSALNADALTLQFEVPVGKHPSGVALDKAGQVWVACRDDDSLWVLDAASGAVRQVLNTAWGSGPSGVVFTPDGMAGFIALEGAGQLQALDPASLTLGAKVAAGTTPHALAVTGDGKRLLVSQFISADGGGTVRSFQVEGLVAGPTLALPLDTASQDGSLAARGLPNYLAGIAIDPGNNLAWIVGKKDNVLRGLFRDGKALTFETTVRAMVGQLDLTLNQEQTNRRWDLDNLSQPSAVALSETGLQILVALQGNNQLVALNPLGREIVRAATGLAPQGIAIDGVSNRVFTQDFMGRTVSVFDGTALLRQGGTTLPHIAQVRSIAAEKLSPAVLRGKQLFYNAADPRMDRDGYISCASCHLDGGHDGQVWDFTDRGEGLRNTIALKGQAGSAGAPLHWTGNFDEVQDFENDIRNAFGGTGFMRDADFLAGTRRQPLGDPKAGISPELDDLAAYVDSLSDPGRSPRRDPTGAMTGAALAGKALFETLGCASCHGGPLFSDSHTGTRHDVGTLKAASGQRLGATLDGLDTPILLGVGASAPYLHDGSAKSLRDVLTTANPSGRHADVAALSPTQLDQLIEYLSQLERETP